MMMQPWISGSCSAKNADSLANARVTYVAPSARCRFRRVSSSGSTTKTTGTLLARAPRVTCLTLCLTLCLCETIGWERMVISHLAARKGDGP